MDVVTLSDACANLEGVLDRILNTKKPLLITRPTAQGAVIVPRSQWDAITATLHSLPAPAKAER